MVSGRLELEVASLGEMAMYMDRTIQDLGMDVLAEQDQTRRVYRIACSREDLAGLLDCLGDVWHRFESTTLYLDTGRWAQSVKVCAIKPHQLGQILGQSDPARSIEVARQIAVDNTLEQGLPGQRLLATAIGTNTSPLPGVPKPVLTSGRPGGDRALRSSYGPKDIRLTVVLMAFE
jgi:hypothetical protein